MDFTFEEPGNTLVVRLKGKLYPHLMDKQLTLSLRLQGTELGLSKPWSSDFRFDILPMTAF